MFIKVGTFLYKHLESTNHLDKQITEKEGTLIWSHVHIITQELAQQDKILQGN